MVRKINFSKIVFAILFIVLPQISNSQVDEGNYGKVHPDQPVAPRGHEFNSDGYHPPLTKKEERLRKKASRLSLSRKEMQILSRKKNGADLTFWQTIRYPFIKRRKKKLDKLKKKADEMGFNNSSGSGGTGKPGYLQGAEKYDLTPKQQKVVKKKEQDSTDLSFKEKIIYWKAKKNKKKKEKYLAKYTKIELTNSEKKLLEKEKANPDSLSKEQKKELKEIHKKEKHNDKVEDRIRIYRNDSVYARGGYVPVKPKKFSLKKIFSRKSKPKQKPSSFVKKQRRINKRYSPTTKQMEAYNKRKSGMKLGLINRYRARRAAVKKYKHKVKTQELQEEEYQKVQHKKTRKKLKKMEKKTKKRDRKRRRKKFWQDFFNMFEKRK